MVRLTPLGWTCIGAAGGMAGGLPQTNFNAAYFVQDKELSSMLQKFWEADTPGSGMKGEKLTPDEEMAIQRIQKFSAV